MLLDVDAPLDNHIIIEENTQDDIEIDINENINHTERRQNNQPTLQLQLNDLNEIEKQASQVSYAFNEYKMDNASQNFDEEVKLENDSMSRSKNSGIFD